MTEAGAKPLQPQISNATRWHSTAGMIERFLTLKNELKAAYDRLMQEQETTSARQDAAKSVATMNQLLGADAQLLEQLNVLLTTIRSKGRAMEDDSGSMASVLEMYFDLVEDTFKAGDEDTSEIKEVEEVMADKLVYRLGAVDPGMSVIAAAVHPGFMLRAKSSRICCWIARAFKLAQPSTKYNSHNKF